MAAPDPASPSGGRRYLFRGDDGYRGGPIGRAPGAEADSADIQSFSDHVLRKESNRSSRYTSFTTEAKIARRFTSEPGHRFVCKVELARLRDLESRGLVKVWDADQVYDSLRRSAGKHARQAADVRAAMRRNREFLVEGRVPAEVLEPVND